MGFQNKSDFDGSNRRLLRFFTCLSLMPASYFLGILATPEKGESSLVYFYYSYLFILPIILWISGLLYAFSSKRYQKFARWGLIIGSLAIVAPFLYSMLAPLFLEDFINMKPLDEASSAFKKELIALAGNN
jgi:hypothetical protein